MILDSSSRAEALSESPIGMRGIQVEEMDRGQLER